MSAVEIISFVVLVLLGGGLTFLATQLIKQPTWGLRTKLVLSVVMAAVFALASAWKAGDILSLATNWDGMTGEALLTYFVTYWTAATLWYKVVFKDTPWVKKLGEWPKAPS